MKIILNGKEEEIREKITVEDLLNEKKIKIPAVTLELNEEILEKNDYAQTFLKEDDCLEIISYMGGG